MSARELHVLMLEDAAADAELCERELRRSGVASKSLRVATRETFERALHEFEPDIILSDFTLHTNFDGLTALDIALEKAPNVPFVFVSGTIGEDRAAEAMKRGATDYVLKGRLQRLGPAVTRAIQEAQERRARSRAEEDIREREARHRLILDTSLDAFVTVDQSGAVMEWSRQAEAMFGWKRAEVRGRPLTETIIPERYRKDHQAALRRVVQTGERKIHGPVEFQALRRSGAELFVELAITPLNIGGQHFFSAFIRDITRRIKSQQRLNVQHAIARVLAGTTSFEDVPSKLLQVTCECMGFMTGALWEVDEKDRVLRCVEIWHGPDAALEQFAARTRGSALRPGAGIAGRAWESGAPIWIPDATVNPRSPRAPFAAQAGLRENLAFPITVRGKITGVADFFGLEAREPEPELLEVFAAVGTQIGQFMERRDQEQKITRLSRIHAVLGGINSAAIRIRDRRELLQEACRVAVEHGKFGLAWVGMLDSVSLDVTPFVWGGLGSDELNQTKTTANADVPLGQGLVGHAIRERKAAFSNELTTERSVGGARRREAVRLGYRSLIVLPLFEGNAVSGVLSLFASEPNYFDDEQLKLLTDLAGDISFALEYIRKEEKLNYLAYYDALTGLPNRTLLHERLTQVLDKARQDGTQVAMLLVDVKRFRLINETLGRHAGDTLLSALSERLRQLWMDADHIARISADCFAVIMPGAQELSQIAYSVEKLLTKLVERPFAVSDRELTVAVTGSVSVFPADGSSTESLFHNAEAALKRAKASGERYLFYQSEMNAKVAENLLLENKMRGALEKEQFVLHYQPKVELASGRISGVEALIRWNDPETGLVPPMQFIRLLEETGMILEAGRWAIRKALEDYRKWHSEGVQPPRISVNVSPIQLKQKDFVDAIRDLVRGAVAGSHGLDLEITESVVMENIDDSIEKLRAIGKLGINVAIDDFGTGHSSLGYLAKLPVNTLKIDRAFIISMDQSPDSMTIVSTIISLAHALKLKVVAEGVDSEKQLQLLKLLKCDEIQGYLFSKPLPAADLLRMLREKTDPV
jgi:diguanylate cyclase